MMGIRIPVLKTYKLFIGGAFPRTESGRYYPVHDASGKVLANVCLASRKDLRNAVSAARQAFGSWSQRSAFNRSQIIYRLAEMLESRQSSLVEELMLQGISKTKAQREVQQSIDTCVYYSGWCDKYSAVFSSVNPVNGSYFNFSVPEPMGVVGMICSDHLPLLSPISMFLAAIAGGNTVVILVSESQPLSALTLAEGLATCDLPAGVVNILSGRREELAIHMASHRDVNALVLDKAPTDTLSALRITGSENMKRVFNWHYSWNQDSALQPYGLMDLQEIKTSWHPIEQISGAGISY